MESPLKYGFEIIPNKSEPGGKKTQYGMNFCSSGKISIKNI
jgi:hypothetical protein